MAGGDLLVQIDDAIPQMQYNVARFKLDVARKQADDDINVRFATSAAAVAKAVCEQDEETNRIVKGAVPQATVRASAECGVQSAERSRFQGFCDEPPEGKAAPSHHTPKSSRRTRIRRLITQGIAGLQGLVLLDQKLAPGSHARSGLGGGFKYPRFRGKSPQVGQGGVPVVITGGRGPSC